MTGGANTARATSSCVGAETRARKAVRIGDIEGVLAQVGYGPLAYH